MKTKVTTTQDLEELKLFKKEILDRVGRKEIGQLNLPNRFLDYAVPLLYYSATFGGIYLLGTLEFSFLWFALFILQGFLFQLHGLISHDIFLHRKAWGKLTGFGKILFGTPIFMSVTNYEIVHLYHHKKIGTLEDPEGYKQDLDSTWKRILFLTFPGFMLTINRVFASEETKSWSENTSWYEILRTMNRPKMAETVKLENRIIYAYAAILIVLTFFFPRFFIMGYFIPYFLSLPLAVTLRTILEHAELDPHNPVYIATYTKSGWIENILFFWDGGDCHLIHHLFPNIPFYNIPKAISLIDPLLKERGVTYQKSSLQVIIQWFTRGGEHRTIWQ